MRLVAKGCGGRRGLSNLDVSGGETTTARLRIDEPGKYTFFCTVPGHRDGGMEGTITVTGTVTKP